MYAQGTALTQIYRQGTLTAGQLDTQGHRLILLLQIYLFSLQKDFYPIAKERNIPVLQSLISVSIKNASIAYKYSNISNMFLV